MGESQDAGNGGISARMLRIKRRGPAGEAACKYADTYIMTSHSMQAYILSIGGFLWFKEMKGKWRDMYHQKWASSQPNDSSIRHGSCEDDIPLDNEAVGLQTLDAYWATVPQLRLT